MDMLALLLHRSYGLKSLKYANAILAIVAKEC
ncbi:hypothetical protein Cha6605_3933 [Chamaesiphon minutus PCC 6605]|uniref:Uncharacterized protein n=1 Tax=Chamaesiphon minutus (strain ATCC 27169 / PCC 6605) TaxID=1173020 RepID=K9UIG9_CHAP6|nr:hypothetical protein Cha6605_3933 [Chamaesiphon minutus PCC 6605]